MACGSAGAPNNAKDPEHATTHTNVMASQAAKMDASEVAPSDGGKAQQPSSAKTTRGKLTPDSGVGGNQDASRGSSEPAGATSKPDHDDAADDAGLTDAGAPSSAGAGAETDGAGGFGGDNASNGTAGAGGKPAAPGAGGFGGGEAFCVHPPSCVPVFTATVGLDTCCPNNGESCGYSVEYPRELDDGTCRPNSAVFLKLPGQAEQRVTTAGVPDQLITPDCETRGVLAFNLPGCCMPDNRCGVSTYQMADILLGLALVPAPFTSVECVHVETLNAQLRASLLAGMGQIPPSDGTCDYADLDTRLPKKEAMP